MAVAAHDLRWSGVCAGCGRERELQTRLDHAAKPLCDRCAARPHRPPSGDALDSFVSDLGAARARRNGTAPAVRPLRTRGVILERVRPPRWAWQQRVPIGYLALLIGAEGIGKGTLLAWVAARLTRGELPGDLHGEPTRVLWIGDEDSFEGIVFPRVFAAGGDAQMLRTLADGEALEDLTGSADALAAAIVDEGFRVVIFDQLLDHLGSGLDDWRAKQVRDALRPLRAIAREHDVAVLAALQPNKGQKANFRELLSGSHQFNALSRSSLLLAAHPDDEDGRALVRGKGNLCAPPASFEFDVHGRDLELNGHGFTVPLVAGEHEGDLIVDELLKPGREAPVLDDLTEQVDHAGTGEVQRRAELARAVGRRPDDRSVGRALNELVADGRWEKVERGKWQKKLAFGIGASSTAPIANRRPTGVPPVCRCPTPAEPVSDADRRCSRCYGDPPPAEEALP